MINNYENKRSQEEVLRALMPNASAEEIEEAKAAVAEFLMVIQQMKAEKKRDPLDATLLDLIV